MRPEAELTSSTLINPVIKGTAAGEQSKGSSDGQWLIGPFGYMAKSLAVMRART